MCDCYERANAALAKQNTQLSLVWNVTTTHKPGEAIENCMSARLALATEKINRNKRGKPVPCTVGHYYCPFCGERLEEGHSYG